MAAHLSMRNVVQRKRTAGWLLLLAVFVITARLPREDWFAMSMYVLQVCFIFVLMQVCHSRNGS
jgi:hypothetical protein